MAGYAGGYMGKILRVDLSNHKLVDEDLPDDRILRDHVGCWSLGLKYLYDMLPPGFAATDPENPLVFMTAPPIGLQVAGATNSTLATKNFNTGFTAGRAHTHGHFGILMKAAGYDGVIVTGQSETPVYLWIHEGKAELKDATHLWGKTDSHEAEDAIKGELGSSKISVYAIGPAGENVCAGGMICGDKNHSFSHSGVGSIAGSKKLKAIAVYGEQRVPAANPEKLASSQRELMKLLQSPDHLWMRIMHNQVGKKSYNNRLHHTGFPGQNFRINQLKEFGLGFGDQKFTPRPCPRCPIGCSYDVEITTGPYKGYVATLCGGGEALEASGSILGITEPGAIFRLADVYDRLGIEASMVGCTLAMAFEAFEKGLITTKDTDGLELRWGDEKVAETLARKMAHREGFGEILARGIKGAAESIGGDAPNFAVNVKGAGMNLHDWRAVWGTLFSQIVGSGAGWAAPGTDNFTPDADAGFPTMTDRFDKSSKPLEAKMTGITKFVTDSTGFCWFITWGTPGIMQVIADILSAATGWDYSREEVMRVGERVMQLERAFNVRHGLRPEDDWTVPARLVEAPDAGPAGGIAMAPYLTGMVKEYHRLMGWDAATGKPLRATLERVGLNSLIGDLWG